VKNYKVKAVLAGIGLLAFLVVGLATAPPVSAAVPADLTLTGKVTQTHEGPASQTFTLKIHLAPAGNSSIHFTVWGKATVAGDYPFYVGGTGILEGNVLTMNLTTTQRHTDGWRDTGIMQARYNVVDYTGSFYEIGHDYNTKQLGEFDQRYSAGTLKK
jgi:hypothetical protein